jgi:hypothetical protein
MENTINTNKFSRGKIYKLVNYKTDDIYVGSTINELRYRKYQHKTLLKGGSNKQLYKRLRNMNITCNDIELVLIENWSCQNIFELHCRERYWIEQISTLNKNIPTRTGKEYYKKNKQYLNEKKKEYYKKNKQYLNEKKKEYYKEKKKNKK